MSNRYLTGLLLALLTCGSFQLTAQLNFQEASAAAGVDNVGRNYGVSIADFDNDGWEDLYFSMHAGPNLLYRSLGDGTFVDVAPQAGVALGGTTNMSIWGDIDNDGDLDLYLANRDQPNVLYRNEGNGAFTDISAQAGVGNNYNSRAVMFGDINGDGYIDLYVANLYFDNALYRNNGDGTFTDITFSAGVNDTQIAMGSLFFDYDNDGDLDIYLTHDANQPNILFRNDGNEQFTDVSVTSNANYAGNGMGVDFGDVNGDGWLDLYITNLYPNTLLLNNGDGTFADISSEAGVTDVAMGWGTVWFDADNDGHQDIYLANDSYFAPFPNVLYRNRGDQTFEVVSEGTSLASMYAGYGVATGDLNNDGRADLVVANSAYSANSSNDSNQLFYNQTESGHRWVKIKTTGTLSNRSGIGTRVTIRTGDRIHVDEVCAGASYASMNSLILHFGLGDAPVIEELHLRWPSGLEESYYDLSVDRTYLVTEGEGMTTSATELTPTTNHVAVFPNPFSASFRLELELSRPQPLTLTLTDLHGRSVRQIQQNRLDSGVHQLEIDGAGLPPGLYLLRVNTDDGQVIRRVVKGDR